MSPRPLGLSEEELLRQDRWLRELVRRLVGESEVEDVVQDSWASALRYGQAVERPRAWLSVVATNFARRTRRSAGRRSRREEAAARPEALPSTEETLELLELQQHVVRALRELSEPYRTTVLLRFTHGLAVREIAARSGVSEAGVRQRLKRGLDLLRGEVCRRGGDQWRNLPALAAWLVPGVLEMKKTTSIVAAALVVASLGALAVWVERPVQPSGGEASELLGLVAESAAEPREPAPDRSQPKAAERAPAASSQARVLPPASAYAGRVLDTRGDPLGGVGIAPISRYLAKIGSEGLERSAPATATASDGSFRLPAENESGHVATGPGWVPVAVRSFNSGAENILLVAAPAVEMSGTVLDSEGAPLEGVTLSVLGVGLRDFNGVLQDVQGVEWLESRTDEGGRFRRRDLPAEIGRLRFEKEGYRALELDIGAFDDTSLALTLEEDEITYRVSGWALAPNGAPVPDALVGLGERTVRAAADGFFELRIPGEQAPKAYDALWAASPPWRTKIVEKVGAALLQDTDRELEHDLVFDGEALALAGQVVDAKGAPIEGLTIYPWLQRELMDGYSAEDLALPEDRELLRVGPGRLRAWARTDAAGRFRLEGLRDTEYRLHLFDRERSAAWTSPPLRAGDEDARLTLPSDFVRAEVTGRVVDLYGEGVAGVTITPMVSVHATDRGYSSIGSEHQREKSDDGGRFVLTDVSGGDLSLSLHGESIMPTNHYFREGDAVTDVEVVVQRICHFRLVLTGEREMASSLQVLDASGEPLNVAALGGGEYIWSAWRLFEGGRTRVLSVGESAAALVLYDGPQREVGRLPLTLRPGDVNEIDW